jgi:hypothetical protein
MKLMRAGPNTSANENVGKRLLYNRNTWERGGWVAATVRYWPTPADHQVIDSGVAADP